MPYNNVVVLTGAGISAESGIKTFRDNNGLWENHAVEDVATPEAFRRNPDLVYDFYNQRRRQLLSPDIKANEAHVALAEFERRFTGDFLLVTQNIDDLHERAGSQNVLHMHGELLQSRCCHSQRIVNTLTDVTQSSRCNCCNPAQALRPNIVWFGEMPMFMDEIEKALSKADLFVAIGTSGQVYPAAGFVAQANYYGAHSVEVNLVASDVHSQFKEHYQGNATEAVPAFFNALLKDS
ncbi:NAD-dependent protein deacylase [Alteromonadaceae bacterium BrNp21-10]|nr:NAD-dependent protein deacylase [Alteromonadaceae bacterium BrNp21-10]